MLAAARRLKAAKKVELETLDKHVIDALVRQNIGEIVDNFIVWVE